MKVISYRIVVATHHIYLVRHHSRYGIRDIHEQRVASDITGVKRSFLVIEVKATYAGKVITYHTNRVSHISAHNQRV